METNVKKLYEAMFLVDSAGVADWDAVNATIRNTLEKAEAQIVSVKKWDDRKLAYEINGKPRGIYILCFFRAEGRKIREIERDVQLSEQIMRVLILSTEGRDKEDVEDPTPMMRAEKDGQKTAQAAKAKAKQGIALEVAEEAEESEQAAEPAADASEAEQPEKAERKDLGEAGETEKGD